MNFPRHSFFLSLIPCVFASYSVACERVALLSPGRLDTLSDNQPTLRWLGDAGQRYRVQVVALLPEARVVASHDIEVIGTQVRLPAPLPVARASVKVLVSHHCPGLDAQDLYAQGPWFFVDVQPACAVDPQSLQASAAGLQWAPVHGAQFYGVRTFDLETWTAGAALTPSAEVEVRGPPWSAPASSVLRQQAWTVRASCAGVWGRAVAWPRVVQRVAAP